jgi:hypothetical protein
MRRGRSVVAGAVLAALLSALSVTVVAHLWNAPLHVPFQYAHTPGDDEQDATLDMMLIKNIHETGWFNTNPALNAPFEQHWAEWPMGGDLLSYTMKKAIVETTGDVPLTLNLFWLLTFPLAALAAFPALRALRCSWASAVIGAVLFSLAPYHFRNGVAHENLAFYVGIPTIVLLCVKMLGPDSTLPSLAELRHRAGWRRIRWLLAGTVLVGVTGLYYLAFLLALLAICATVNGLANRRLDRIPLALLFGGVGLATSFLANLPTLLYRWNHVANMLGVPDREPGVSEAYPLRLVELLSPITQHRFGPFSAIADQFYERGREGLGTAELGLAAAIGFVCAVVTVLVRAIRSADRRGWSLESRLGIVMVAALLLGMKGGLSRALELTGLQGVRAWNRIAIVVAFAGIVVFARLLDRVRVLLRRRRWRRPRALWTAMLVVVLVAGVLDQTSPASTPNPRAREAAWKADGVFVQSIERVLPNRAMVFQLPVVDFPEHSAVERLSADDLIKEGYLHSDSLRWSAGGMRGRDGEWQWPASLLATRDLVRGLMAMGFSGLTLDRDGFSDYADSQLHELTALLGTPIATEGRRLVAWDLRPVEASLLGTMSAAARHALAQHMLDAPLLYLSSDTDPIVSRGDRHDICGAGTLSLVNPGPRPDQQLLEITFTERTSGARHGHVTINGHRISISAGHRANVIPVDLAPGTTKARISINRPDVRCRSVASTFLPSISATLLPAAGARNG